jgi:hypothetical protein
VLDTLQHAYAGFGVVFDEGRAANREVRIEDTSYAANAAQRMSFGAAGATYPASTVSRVYFDVVSSLALAVAQCESLTRCHMPRAEVLRGIGTGIGATAAHELGHQAGFEFSTDSDCTDCYDGRMSGSRVHFFGEKHWSPGALQAMKRVLPAM